MGETITTRYREDPWEAMVSTFVDLTRRVQGGVI